MISVLPILHLQAAHYGAVRARLWPSQRQFIKRAWQTPTVIEVPSPADRLAMIVREIGSRRYVTARDIVDITALAFDFPPTAILGRSRLYCEPRQIAMALAFRQMHGVSFKLAKVKRVFRRDHSTVLHAVRKYEALIETAEDRNARALVADQCGNSTRYRENSEDDMAKAKTKLSSAGRKRLLKLAGLLEKDAKNKKGVKFDLGTWAKPANADYLEQYTTRANVTPSPDCGTAACAVGLACISGAFAREGLTIAPRRWDGGMQVGYIAVPAFGRLRDFPAVRAFFDLDKHQSRWLFMSQFYRASTGARAERAVAKRIRDFVAGRATP